jgi:hypothetical protein
MRKIKLIIDQMEFKAELNDCDTAKAIEAALPIEGHGDFWGEEIYFSIRVKAPLENPQEVVAPGTIAYWPPGRALCIFWGPTPASRGDECRPASPVNVVGRITSDLAPLKRVTKPEVTVESID